MNPPPRPPPPPQGPLRARARSVPNARTAAPNARTAARLVPLLLALLAACGPAGSPTPADDEPRPATGADAPTPPDLVLVVVDTLRADRLSVYDYHRPTSPGLERLAGGGVVFDDVTAQSSWTLPSMASLLSGRRVFVNAYRMPNGVPALAERLAERGYETFAFVANPNLGHDNGFARGFEHFVTREDTGGTTWDVFDLERAVQQRLAAHPRDERPRFFYLHVLDPHWPYTPAGQPALEGEPRLRDDTLEAWMAEVAADDSLRPTFDRDRRSILADLDAYDREIVNVDAVLERLVPAIAAPRRLTVVASDHGEVLWDRRHHEVVVQRDLARTGAERSLREVFFRDHAFHMFRELLFTPLIVAGEGFPAGLRVGEPVENVDIVPTLLRAAGLPDDPQLDGRALQDVVSGDAPAPEAVYAHSNEATLVRLTDSAHELIFPTDTGFSFGMPIMAFDLGVDPVERRNVYERSAAGQGLERLRRLMGLRERAVSGFELYDDEPFDVPSDDLRERMAQLGYVGEAFEGGGAGADPGAGTPPSDAADDPNEPPLDGR